MDEDRQGFISRAVVAAKAREWAAHYPMGSDGRNTFVLFAEWVEGNNYAEAAQAARPRLEGET